MKDPKGPVKSYKSPEELAKKHKVSLEKIMQQVRIGTKIEGEHTTNKGSARITALQHVDEFPDYYTRLKKVEKIKESKEETTQHRTRKPSQIQKKVKLAYLLSKMERTSKDTKESLEVAKMGLEGKRYCKLCRKAETQDECSFGPEMWTRFSIATVHPANEEVLGEKKGLWDNIHARRKAGKPPKKPGEKGYPKTLDIEEDHKEIASGKKKDEEGYMANIEMDKMTKSVEILRKIIKKPDMQLPAWVQSKITRAADFIDTAAEYMSSDETVSEGLKQAQQNVGASKCWTGKKVGKPPTKIKGGKEVPNCVPAEDTCFTFSQFMTEVAAWQKKAGKNPEGGLNEKGRKSYERENPGSNLQAPQPEGGPRKRSFCARMGGMPGPMKDEKGRPTRKALALRKWAC
jgi:HEPN domain-containing protein